MTAKTKKALEAELKEALDSLKREKDVVAQQKETIDTLRQNVSTAHAEADDAFEQGKLDAIESIKARYSDAEPLRSTIITFTDREGEEMVDLLDVFYPNLPDPFLRLALALRSNL